MAMEKILEIKEMINKVVFMGSPVFAIPSLNVLINSKFCPELVITQPDKPQGRKKKLTPTPIKQLALENNIEVITPEDVNSKDVLNLLKGCDLIVTVAYGGYLKKEIRLLPKFGCINLHPSLLPLYRGSSPLIFPFLNDDQETGYTIFKIRAKMDAGTIIYQDKIKIEKDDCYTSMHDKLSEMGAEGLLKVINLINDGKDNYVKQDDCKATYCSKIEKKDTWIKWNSNSNSIRNKIRAFSLSPGAVAKFRDNRIKILDVEVLDSLSKKIPGTILEIKKNIGIVVATKDNDILIKSVQPAGKKIMTSYAFYLGAKCEINEKFLDGF